MTNEHQRPQQRDRLYAEPGAEWMRDDPDDAAATYSSIAAPEPGSTFLIEEWTVHPPRYHLDAALSVDRLLALVLDTVHDEGELTEIDGPWFDTAAPEVLVAAHTLYDVIAATVTWRMADQHVANWRYRQPDEDQNDDYPILLGVEPVGRTQ